MYSVSSFGAKLVLNWDRETSFSKASLQIKLFSKKKKNVFWELLFYYFLQSIPYVVRFSFNYGLAFGTPDLNGIFKDF